MEVRTAGIVAKALRALGYEVKEGIGKTGVAGVLKNGSGPVIMYRADMDCNAVKEITGLPYASTKIVKKEDGTETPVMHACGHDAHTTWLIGIAKVMANNKNLWKGTLVLVAQPAEEPILGAEAMVNDGLYTKHGIPEPDALFAMHTTPAPLGMAGTQERGPQMAGTDQIDVVFKGVGGHGSTPHLAKDPVIMAADAVVLYQNIISRGINAQHAAVLTVGAVQAGSDNNVIPASALVKINLRWFDSTDRRIMVEGIKRINNSIASAYNLPDSLYPTIAMKGWSYPLVNDSAIVAMAAKGFSQVVPPQNIITNVPAAMGSEDAHHLVIHNPKHAVGYFVIGVADPAACAKAVAEGRGVPYANHNGNYVVELRAIPLGTKLGVSALLELFASVKQ